ncbi:MAG: RdgB/HAM1 family non-canonical purine NTP pyrophosphatase [Patescibacteria group bacterium]|nr:RdgB/HAM1 family non-canonical purine NTP pyrophosphatase [Patescibacteria group bacterium]
MKQYNFRNIEKKWQDKWDKSGIYDAKDFTKKPKYYCLIEFPYPSGAGLHVGHLRSHIAIDIVARQRRMSGYNVMFPIGWDAFGLPTENFAIKTKTHPKVVTKNNIKNFTRQIKSYGPSFDWSREINTTDIEYYKWTQWIFLKLFNSFYDKKSDKAKPIEDLKIPKNLNEIEKKEFIDNHRLAYEKEMAINWCPSCKIGLANEEVVNGACERCGALAERKVMRQWMLRITKYADRLIKDLDSVDYLNKIRTQQINWIGKSEGAEIKFSVIVRSKATKQSSQIQVSPINSELLHSACNDSSIKVFTTRPDTLFGCTYMVLSPEHSLIEKLKDNIENYSEVEKYILQAKNKSDLDRTDLAKEKSGVELKGIKAINPASNEEIPIWIADYVLSSYGTGAIMAVPAHDERDFEFAKKFGIKIKEVVAPLFKVFSGDDVIRPEKKTVRQKIVIAFLKHWNEDKYLCLDWKKFNWHTGIIGGIEEGETAQEAGKREIQEETGYKNLKFIRHLGSEQYNTFFNRHKDENRYSVEQGLLFKLEDESLEKPSEEETINHNTVWIDSDKMDDFLNLSNQKMLWQRLIGKAGCFKEDGVNVNSDFLNGLETPEAKKEITAWLEKNKLGKKAVNFKLRDWIFSRQHYWGEPIPIVKCKECGLKKLNIKMELNFRVNKIWDQIICRKKTVETRAFNPEEKDKYFGNIKIGDFIKINNKNTNEFEVIKINKVYNFENLEKLFNKKDLIKKIIPNTKIRSFKELEKCFSFTNDYLNKIQKNGLVGWEFEIINITKNIPLNEKNLPLELPNVKNYEPTETGESPLANIKKWVEVKCPKCKGEAKRETDTMPNWAGSSWYFLRYLDPKNKKEFASRKKIEYWMPVDLYNGGMEHTTLHLLYSRFWHKFLFDLGYVNTREPYAKRRSHGMILAENGQKMSKSRGNVVNPDDVIKQYGSDTLRLYEMFMGPYGDAIPWNTTSLIGMNRFLERVWNMQKKIKKHNIVNSNVETQDFAFPYKNKIILIATNNQGKLKELKNHLANFNIISLKDIDKSIEEPEENGKTFAENSLIKAKYYAQKTGYLTIADDSGLCINTLDGRPGVFSSRYSEGDYKKAYQKIFKELVDKKDRSAYFQSVVTLYNPKDKKYNQFEGKCEGEILEKSRGTRGFGYDSIFMPNVLNKSFGECSSEDKYRFDHRKQATDKLIEYLQKSTQDSAFLQDQKIESLLHKTIKKVTEDIENMKFNTAISQMMILLNEMEKEKMIFNSQYSIFLILLSPFAPHITEELWEMLGEKKSIHLQSWPKINPLFIKETEINLVIQINGKLRDQIKVPANISEEEAKKLALESEKIQKWIAGKEVRKVIFVKGRLVNIVI